MRRSDEWHPWLSTDASQPTIARRKSIVKMTRVELANNMPQDSYHRLSHV